MKLGIIAVGMVLGNLMASTETAFAQVPYRQPARVSSRNMGAPKMRTNRPTVSPYLNLLSGRGIGFEYYGRVRPQQEFRRTATALGRSIQDLQSAQAQTQAAMALQPDIGTTGHAATFMSHSRFFGVGLSGSTPGMMPSGGVAAGGSPQAASQSSPAR